MIVIYKLFTNVMCLVLKFKKNYNREYIIRVVLMSYYKSINICILYYYTNVYVKICSILLSYEHK